MIEKVVTTVYKIEIQGEPFNLTEEELGRLVREGMKILGIKEQTGMNLNDLAEALKKKPGPNPLVQPIRVPEIPFRPRGPQNPYDDNDGYDPHWYPDGTGYPYKAPPQVMD